MRRDPHRRDRGRRLRPRRRRRLERRLADQDRLRGHRRKHVRGHRHVRLHRLERERVAGGDPGALLDGPERADSLRRDGDGDVHGRSRQRLEPRDERRRDELRLLVEHLAGPRDPALHGGPARDPRGRRGGLHDRELHGRRHGRTADHLGDPAAPPPGGHGLRRPARRRWDPGRPHRRGRRLLERRAHRPLLDGRREHVPVDERRRGEPRRRQHGDDRPDRQRHDEPLGQGLPLSLRVGALRPRHHGPAREHRDPVHGDNEQVWKRALERGALRRRQRRLQRRPQHPERRSGHRPRHGHLPPRGHGGGRGAEPRLRVLDLGAERPLPAVHGAPPAALGGDDQSPRLAPGDAAQVRLEHLRGPRGPGRARRVVEPRPPRDRRAPLDPGPDAGSADERLLR